MDNKDQEEFTLKDFWEMVMFGVMIAVKVTIVSFALYLIFSVFGYYLLAGYYVIQVIIGLIVFAALFGWIFY